LHDRKDILPASGDSLGRPVMELTHLAHPTAVMVVVILGWSGFPKDCGSHNGFF